MKVFPYDLITKIALPANTISVRVKIPTDARRHTQTFRRIHKSSRTAVQASRGTGQAPRRESLESGHWVLWADWKREMVSRGKMEKSGSWRE